MFNKIKIISLSLMTIFCLPAMLFSQNSKDDFSANFNDLIKVLSFSKGSNVFYRTITRTEAIPILQSEDTSMTVGEFQKQGNIYYISNGKEELFIDDSLYIQVDNNRKSILISKIDSANKFQINFNPLENVDIQSLVRQNYKITRIDLADNYGHLILANEKRDKSLSDSTSIWIDYEKESYLPIQFILEMQIKMPLNENELELMNSKGPDYAQYVQTIDGRKYLTRKQSIKTTFDSFSTDRKKIPLWRDKFQYDKKTNEYAGKLEFKDFEIVKMF